MSAITKCLQYCQPKTLKSLPATGTAVPLPVATELNVNETGGTDGRLRSSQIFQLTALKVPVQAVLLLLLLIPEDLSTTVGPYSCHKVQWSAYRNNPTPSDQPVLRNEDPHSKVLHRKCLCCATASAHHAAALPQHLMTECHWWSAPGTTEQHWQIPLL